MMATLTLSLGGLLVWSSLWVEMFQFTRFDATAVDKGVDLGLLQANHATKTVCGKLALVDQSVERAGRQAQRRSGFLGGQPVSIGLRHTSQRNTISASLSLFEIKWKAQR
jgi:hypothetical protein